MKTNVWIAGLLVTGAAAMPARSGMAQEGPSKPQGKKVVLLIGVDQYKSPLLEGRRLNGCVNDVNAIASLLPRFDGFPKVGDDHFHLLRNEEATRDAILRAFDRVVAQVDGTRDLVYI